MPVELFLYTTKTVEVVTEVNVEKAMKVGFPVVCMISSNISATMLSYKIIIYNCIVS